MDTFARSIADDPRIDIRHDAIIGNLLPGSGKWRLSFKCSPLDLPIRHLREPEPGSVTDYVEKQPFDQSDDLGAVRTIEGPVIYAGPIWYHFGHFVTDCVHRLWPRLIYPELARAKVAYHWNWKRTKPFPDWAIEILGFFKISVDDVLFIDRPMSFQELYLPHQGRIPCGPEQFPGYDQFVSELTTNTGDRFTSQSIYFSRAEVGTASLIGERILEEILASAGFAIHYPEKTSISETIARLRAANIIIFAEGSAIHNLELCGPINAEVFVISRRIGSRSRFGRLLDDLTARSFIYENITPLFPLEWDMARDTPAYQSAPAVLDLMDLVAAISSFTGMKLPSPDPGALHAAVRGRIADYVLDDPNGPARPTTDEQLGAALRRLRAQVKTLNLP